jgi:hypothetical protein
MAKVLGALTGLALLVSPLAAGTAFAAPPQSASAKKKSVSRKQATPAKPFELPPLSMAAQRVTGWVAESGDNQALPYIVIDKRAATILVYDAGGKPVASGPVLIGIAEGDEATPGVGTKSLSEIGPAEKTTPAGRFLAKFGKAAGNTKVLWVDYATSVAIHTIPVGNKENRATRMLSPAIDDNRVTFGCINVPKAIYNGKIAPMFGKKGGYVYILPDTKPLEAAFPPLHARPVQRAFR